MFKYILYSLLLTVSINCSKNSGDVNLPIVVNNNDIDSFISISNNTRQDVGVVKTVWDNNLEQKAKSYVNTLINNGKFEHENNRELGENLYASSNFSNTIYTDAVNSWVDEKKYYDYNSNSCIGNSMCGHYTQVVWNKSTKVGCASGRYKTGKYKNWIVVVCKYYPHGNFIGQYPY